MGFPSPCGVWVVSLMPELVKSAAEFPSPCGVWVVSLVKAQIEWVKEFPSPCGVWVVSIRGARKTGEIIRVSVPLRGVGCFDFLRGGGAMPFVSVPLRGVGCFEWLMGFPTGWRFPSPCGVWVVSYPPFLLSSFTTSFRPLAGCGLFRQSCTFFLVQQEKELSTLLFYCIILADVYQ